MSVPVTIYTTPTCPYCTRAKQLLTNKGVDFTEISMYDVSSEDRQALAQKTNNYRTVPQIFIGERFIGGSDDLAKLERENQLDALLAG
ncbi:glutaredoxin 3 [Faucicola boevrei]|uniref:glutaredoxin 3 n=1 Tax=Faucicola boevrei TaxID=346665 RepID=UPI000368A48A|nr:glutaredoxin 3 [Moraxella boevrei]